MAITQVLWVVDMQIVDTDNIFGMYSEEEIENFRCIFEMFDKDKTGFIEVHDLQTIMKSLGRDPTEGKVLFIAAATASHPHLALELLQALDLNSDGKLSFEEFLKIMKSLENRLVQARNTDAEISPREASQDERAKYGCLLPRTGVHFLPDSKVVDFLK